MIIAQCQCGRFYARRQCDVGQVYNLAQCYSRHIDFDVVRYITWQTLNFHVGSLMLHHTAAHLHAFANIFVGEVERHVDLNGLVGLHAQKIDVHRKAFGGMTLHIF